MIGTGIFTSLGFQLENISLAFTILLLWIVGGVTALFGAFAYGELGSLFPRSGGEYHFLGKIYHPLIGFLAGWVSFVIGFSAPIAAAGIAAGKYTTSVFVDVGLISVEYQTLMLKTMACVLVFSIALIHTSRFRTISIFQNFFTGLKISLIVVLCVFGFMIPAPQDISFLPDLESISAVFSSAFAVSLVFVMYSYSGWNASAYIINEIDNPRRNMPLSLSIGTLIVILLYVSVNGVFLYTAPIEAMAGKEEIGYIASAYIFGRTGGIIMGLLIALGLISAISSMTWAGPRVVKVMGEDYQVFRFFSRNNKNNLPVTAIFLQTALVLVMIITSTFEDIIYYIGLMLTLSSFLAVLGVFILRIKRPELPRSYAAWGYPFTTAFFLIVTGWMMTYIVMGKPVTVLYSLLTLAVGMLVYLLIPKEEKMK
jgi:APA family basic amino acid/polyamine antiporter